MIIIETRKLPVLACVTILCPTYTFTVSGRKCVCVCVSCVMCMRVCVMCVCVFCAKQEWIQFFHPAEFFSEKGERTCKGLMRQLPLLCSKLANTQCQQPPTDNRNEPDFFFLLMLEKSVLPYSHNIYIYYKFPLARWQVRLLWKIQPPVLRTFPPWSCPYFSWRTTRHDRMLILDGIIYQYLQYLGRKTWACYPILHDTSRFRPHVYGLCWFATYFLLICCGNCA